MACNVQVGGTFLAGLFADPNDHYPGLPFSYRVTLVSVDPPVVVDVNGSGGWQVTGYQVIGAWPFPVTAYVTVVVPLNEPEGQYRIEYSVALLDAYKDYLAGGIDYWFICKPDFIPPFGPPPPLNPTAPSLGQISVSSPSPDSTSSVISTCRQT